MELSEYGNKNSKLILIQPVDSHDLQLMESEIRAIRGQSDKDFRLIACKVDDWNRDLSPWKAPAVFGNEDFGDGAGKTLKEIIDRCVPDKDKTYCIGGYSLAGLFSLWAASQTDIFRGVAAASASLWFPDFYSYLKEHRIKSPNVYLSLGDKEEKTRNPVMATVGEKTVMTDTLLKEQGINCVFEWNKGNHFMDSDLRTARAFATLMNRMKGGNESRLVMKA